MVPKPGKPCSESVRSLRWRTGMVRYRTRLLNLGSCCKPALVSGAVVFGQLVGQGGSAFLDEVFVDRCHKASWLVDAYSVLTIARDYPYSDHNQKLNNSENSCVCHPGKYSGATSTFIECLLPYGLLIRHALV